MYLTLKFTKKLHWYQSNHTAKQNFQENNYKTRKLSNNPAGRGLKDEL